MSWSLFVSQLINGLGLTGQTLLVAVSLTTMLNAVRVLNVAIGSMIVLSAIVAIRATDSLGVAGLIIVAAVASMIQFALLEVLVLRPQRSRVEDIEMGSFAATLGVATALTALAAWITGSQNVDLPSGFLRFRDVAQLGSVSVSYIAIVVFVVGTLMAAGFSYWLRKRPSGMLFRAVSSNRPLSEAIGVGVGRVALNSAVVGALFTAVATILIVVQTRSVSSGSASDFLLLPFAAVIAGGMGSLWGTFIASLVFGLAEAFLEIPIGTPSLRDAAVFGLMFVILVVRPDGLIPRVVVGRDY